MASTRQRFIDYRFIAASQDVALVVNPPARGPTDVFPVDQPWEAFRMGWSSIAEDEGVFKMWYAACDDDQWSGGQFRMCYATSEDGLTWHRPNLGLVDYKGSMDRQP